ncbi:MAG: hypothetical protein CEN88_394 [Candidatus Berkelbacteria bacterium Licking1014_2]|uniref:Uncharacterized protein n=1 Tax=Candidatus Berkelbacteria bacterium Licking1014_2 TaxID=2017146 RepID=A0A554LTB2_9BACT|nr:MAG: hypothetical protein CEN88_394 [Candidatus Berkelbacteria bacterium Licking1014_2]
MLAADLAGVINIAGADNFDRAFGLKSGTAKTLITPPPGELSLKDWYQPKETNLSLDTLSIMTRNLPRPDSDVKYERYLEIEKQRKAQLAAALSGAESAGKTVDWRLKIDSPLTYQFLAGLLTPYDYRIAVGRQAAKTYGANALIKELGGTDLWKDYRLGANEIFDIVSGNGEGVFQRLGGWQIDNRLSLPIGTGAKLLTATSGDERQKVMAEAGGQLLGDIAGLGYVKLDGNVRENIGQSRIEEMVGLVPGTFTADKDLRSIINANTIQVFAVAFRVEESNWSNLTNLSNESNLSNLSYLPIAQAADQPLPTEVPRQTIDQGLPGVKQTTAIGRFLDNLKSPTAKDKANWQSIDDLLRVDRGTTQKLMAQEISPSDYLNKVGRETIVKQLGNPGVLNNLAETMGYEPTSAEGVQFINNASGLVRFYQNFDNKDGKLSAQEWIDGYNTASQLFSINLDTMAGTKEGFFRHLIANPSQTKKLVLEEGVRQIGEDLGLVNQETKENYLSIAYNMFEDYQVNPDGAKAKLGLYAKSNMAIYLQQKVTDLTKHDNGQPSVSMPIEDAMRLADGNMRVLTWVAAADLVNKINYDKDNPLPAEFQTTYADAKAMFDDELTDEEMARVETEKNAAAVEYLSTAADEGKSNAVTNAQGQTYYTFDDGDYKAADKEAAAAELGAQAEINAIKTDRRKNLEYKFYDSQVWKIDNNIAVGTAKAFLDKNSTGKDRANATFGYLGNAIHSQHETVPAEAVEYFGKWAGGTLSEEEKAGAGMNAVYAYGDKTLGNLFPNFNLPSGFTASLLVAAKNDWDFNATDAKINGGQSFNQLGEQWLKDYSFSFLDKKVGWGIGKAKEIYTAASGFSGALNAYKGAASAFQTQAATAAASGVELPAEVQKSLQGDVTNAKQDLQAAEAAVITLVITMVFSEQIASMENSLGLVPGTGAMLVGL